jgi:autotransporter-associated beta strand protein
VRPASGLFSSCWGCCSPLLISGYGANKVVAFTGDTAGTGEFAGSIADPHDRTGKAKTEIHKTGTGKWTLSGSNTCTGPITISLGTLCADGAPGPGAKPDTAIPTGSSLELNFNGQVIVSKLTLDGKPQAPGYYSATSTPGFLTGTGILQVPR